MRVAIIGCGAVGAYLAWRLSEKHKVTIFEQKSRLGKTACSGLISSRIWDFIPENNSLVQNKITSATIHFKNKDSKIIFEPPLLALDRPALDRYLAELALKKGAKLVLEKIQSFPKGYDRIIGCDGALSAVREQLKLPKPDFRLGIKCQLETEDSSSEVEIWPVKKGFAWRIPRGRTVEYGLLAPISRAKEEFLHFCIKQNIKPTKTHSAIVPSGLIVPADDKITLCGDSIGLTKPWSGGGVIWGLTAAEILMRTFPDFKEYSKLLKKFFYPKILSAKVTTNLVNLFGSHFPWILPSEKKIDTDFLF